MFSHGNGFIGWHWFFLKGAPETYETSGVAFLAFFMLTDPPTSPNRYGDQVWFGLMAAVSACLTQLLGAGQVYLLIGVLVANAALAAVRYARRQRNTALVSARVAS